MKTLLIVALLLGSAPAALKSAPAEQDVAVGFAASYLVVQGLALISPEKKSGVWFATTAGLGLATAYAMARAQGNAAQTFEPMKFLSGAAGTMLSVGLNWRF